jgi:hypothetical protein
MFIRLETNEKRCTCIVGGESRRIGSQVTGCNKSRIRPF